MKPRTKRNQKRPRGGIGCLMGDGVSSDDDGAIPESPSSFLRVDVVHLSKAFEMISERSNIGKRRDPNADENNCSNTMTQRHNQRRVRIIHPYPFTFATFAKSRWIGRTVVDIYHEEFGECLVFVEIAHDSSLSIHYHSYIVICH